MDELEDRDWLDDGIEDQEEVDESRRDSARVERPGLFRRAAEGLLTGILIIYVLGLNCSLVYFNWQYAQRSGFLNWLLLGQIVPTVKAVVWPYFIAKDFTQSMSDVELDRCMMAWGAAMEMPRGSAERIQTYEKSFRHAQRVDRTRLNEQIPGAGDAFEEWFLPGLEKKIDGIKTENMAMEISGDRMMMRWREVVVQEAAKQGWEVQIGP